MPTGIKDNYQRLIEKHLHAKKSQLAIGIDRRTTANMPADAFFDNHTTSVLSQIADCFFLLRIPLLAPVWTIIILGWIAGSPDAKFLGMVSSGALASTGLWKAIAGFSLIVSSIYVVNQIVDIESDRINRKLFLLPHGYVSVKTAWALAGFCMTGGILIAVSISTAMVIVFTLSLALGAVYNFHLKNRPLGGLWANALGHGMLTFMVGWLAASGGRVDLGIGIISGLAAMFANGAVFLATTIPDSAGDRETGKKTFCVAYGEKKTAIASAIFCAAAAVSSFFISHHAWVMILPSLVCLVLFVRFAASTTREKAFKAFKWPVFLLSGIVALYAPEYSVLIVLTFFGSRAYYKWRFNMDYPSFKAE